MPRTWPANCASLEDDIGRDAHPYADQEFGDDQDWPIGHTKDPKKGANSMSPESRTPMVSRLVMIVSRGISIISCTHENRKRLKG